MSVVAALSFGHKKAPPALERVTGHRINRQIMTQSPESRNSLAALIDYRRTLAAQIAGVNLQIAMLMDDRVAAQQCLQEMNAQIAARYAVREVAE